MITHLSYIKRFDTNYGYNVIFKNKTTAVKVAYDWKVSYLFVQFYKLIEGKIVDNPIIINENSKLTSFYLDDLLLVKEDNFIFKQLPAKEFLTDQAIIRRIQITACFVKEYATDILLGDFTVLSNIETLVKSR